MSGREIPAAARTLVSSREGGLCARCGGVGTDWHHRRSRRVRDAHRHCPCNGVLLCRGCHNWAHSSQAAVAQGYRVSTYQDSPTSVPVLRLGRWWQHLCDGTARHLDIGNAEISIPLS